MFDILQYIINKITPLTVYAASGANVNTNEGTLGGGQILQQGGDSWTYMFFNESVINQFKYYTGIKVVVCILLVLTALLVAAKILGIRSIFKGKAVSYEMEHINNVRSRDAFILQTNKWIAFITKFVKGKGIKISSEQKSYMKYNIERAGLKVPGGFRYLTPDEFNALTTLGFTIFFALGVVVFIFLNMFFGLAVIAVAYIVFNTLPMLIVRQIVSGKDAEIRESFPDLYLMIHYELLSESGTPLTTTFKSFTRITKSKEMLKFVDDCMNLMDTYGEMGATAHISSQYREVPEVTRLMRLIKQQNEGANIKSELIGFREQIIKDKKFRINQQVNKLVAKARMSFNLNMILLVQAIISAMAIYLPDLGIMNF